MRRPEQELQKTIVDALRLALPSRWVVAHYPSGGYRTKAEAGILKAMGVVPGFPDIMILGEIEPCPPTAWFLELKAGKGPVTDDQKEMHNRLRALGFDVAVARSLDDAFESCRFWQLPLRMTGI